MTHNFPSKEFGSGIGLQCSIEFVPFRTLLENSLNPHTPVAQKVADKVVFRRFQSEGVEFFLIGSHRPPSDFDAHLSENTN